MGRTDMEKEDLYEVNKNDNTKRLMLSAICVLMLLVIALCVYLLLFYNKKGDDNSSEQPSATAESSFVPAIVTSETPDNSLEEPSTAPSVSEPDDEPSQEISSVAPPVSSDEPSSESSGTSQPAGELDYQWYGYIYRYMNHALEDFTPGAASKQAYIDAVNSLCTAIGKGKNFYQIIIPTQVEFLRSTFPPEVTSSKGDGFYNQSQASFIKRVADESVVDIKNIDVTALFAEKYAAEEYIYFNTDKNYTALGAYYAYSEYCKAAGLTPVSLSELTEYTVDRFLGSFYTSTDSETLRENPDSVIFYDLDAKFPSDVTIYNGTSIFNKQKMIYKEVSSVANGFNVFFGREAYRIEIAVKEPTSNKSILVIGDLAAAPFVPFLSANYKNITYINATQFNDKYYVSMGEFLKDKSYDDILVIDYTTSYKSPFFFASNIKAMMEN